MIFYARCNSAYRLRYWNFYKLDSWTHFVIEVATVLTACGIETSWYPTLKNNWSTPLQQCLPLAVLKQCNWECSILCLVLQQCLPLAVLKLFLTLPIIRRNHCRLQQCLPLAVLKPPTGRAIKPIGLKLQQCLPLAVLKRLINVLSYVHVSCCNSAYRLRYWNSNSAIFCLTAYSASCNSAYHLRYWN